MPITSALFDERKAAEAAAFLLHRAGGTLPFIKLVKLLYLAERLSFKRYGEPLTGDRLVSMDHGPVLSRTYDHIKGARPTTVEGGWEDWISDKAGYNVGLQDPSKIRTPEQDLEFLSASDLEVLGEVWKQFGHYDRWALVDFTHTLPEWEDPDGSSIPIQHQKLFESIGFTQQEIADLIERLSAQSAFAIS